MKLVPQCDATEITYKHKLDVDTNTKKSNYLHQMVSEAKFIKRIKAKLKDASDWFEDEKKFVCRFVLFTHQEWDNYVDMYQKRWFEAGKLAAKKDAAAWRKEGREEALAVIQGLEEKYRNLLANEFMERFKEEDQRVGGRQPVILKDDQEIPIPQMPELGENAFVEVMQNFVPGKKGFPDKLPFS